MTGVTESTQTHDFWWLRLDSSHEKRWWLDSSHVFTEWLDSSHNQWRETRVRAIFTKSLSLRWASPVRLHIKKWEFVVWMMFKIGASVRIWLSGGAMPLLRIKCPKLHRSRPEILLFADGSIVHNIVTPYRSLMQYLHIVIMTVGVILLLWVFSRKQ